MKFSQIKRLCKEADECIIYDDGVTAWIGTRDAAYPVEGIDIDTASIKTLLDWPDVEADIAVCEMTLEGSALKPDGIDRCDASLNRWAKLEQSMAMYANGDWVLPLVHSGGVLFVAKDKIKPAMRRNEYLGFRLAYNRRVEPLIVIENGLMVTGIVRPEGLRTAELIIETLEKLIAKRAQGTPADAKPREEEAPEEEIDRQITMDEAMEAMREGTEPGDD